jgi:hypothetical protein
MKSKRDVLLELVLRVHVPQEKLEYGKKTGVKLAEAQDSFVKGFMESAQEHKDKYKAIDSFEFVFHNK